MANLINISTGAQITKFLFDYRKGAAVVQASGGTQGTLVLDVGRTIGAHTASSTLYQSAGVAWDGSVVFYFTLVNGGTKWVEPIRLTEIRDAYWTSLDGTGVGIVSGAITAGSGNIAGATVTLTKGAYSASTTSAVTSGAYSFTGVPATTGYTVAVTKTGYTGASATVDVAEDTTTTQNLVLVEYGSIAGTCKDDAAADLAGATVTITKGTVTETTTSADGAYEITGVPVDTGYTLTVAKTGYVTGSYTVDITEATETTQNVVASNYGSISGTVTDADGNVEGAVVEIYANGTVTPALYTATTVANGTYAIANVAPATYDGKISKANHVDLVISDQAVVASTDKVIDGVLPMYATLSGAVTAAPDPEGALVELYTAYPGTPAYSGAAGALPGATYAIENIAPGTYQIRASLDGYTPYFNHDYVIAGDDDLTLNIGLAIV